MTKYPKKSRNWVIGCIENMLERIVDDLLAENEQLTIKLKTRTRLSRRHLGPVHDPGTIPPPRNVELSYPGNNAQDARRFSAYLDVVGCFN